MTLKAFISPYYDPDLPDRAEGGIRRVVEAQIKYLPQFGVKVVKDINKADIYNAHVQVHERPQGLPLVHSVHGLHWSPDYHWHNWAHEVNRDVINGMVQADAITAVSEWVRYALVRGMYCDPKVVYHGVDPDEWLHMEPHENYVLWNKARRDPVSNDADMQKLAEYMPSTKFVSTVGAATSNVSIVGVLPLPMLKGIIQRAGVYLATARETMGVGTLEALACGVPVVGWDYGGQSEIIVQGETGYLAPYGNYEALAQCVNRAMAERERLSVNAIDDIRARWLWPDKIQKYAELYKTVLEGSKTSPKVSVITTCHNLAHFLPDAIQSALNQPFKDWELLVIDDCSSDNTEQVAKEWAERDNRIRYLRTPHNLKLSLALNFGAQHARGKYLLNLDADNMLGENALAIQAKVLDENPDLHIVYGMVDTMSRDGSNRSRAEGWPFEFDWRKQMAHLNCIQSSAMHRKSIRLLSGGYRERMWRAEDGEFWARVTSYGARARKVTEETTLIYRNRGDSKSSGEYNNYADKDGDWVAWFPWRTAATAQDGADALRQRKKTPNVKSVPFACSGRPEINNALSWNVWHHQHPVISVIIPVGGGHKEKVIDALDSLRGQAMVSWEAIVVNDTGEEWLDGIAGAPFARIVSTGGKRGAGYARNLGVAHAKAPLVFFLDADDYMHPVTGLKKLLQAYAAGDAAYVYSDYFSEGRGIQSAYNQIVNSNVEIPPYFRDLTDKQVITDFLFSHTESYSRNAKISFVYLNDRESFRRFEVPEYGQDDPIAYHAVNILIAKKDFLSVGGFDEKLPGWEDWDLFCKLAVAGLCGKRVAEPCFIYREHEGKRRNQSLALKDELLPVLNARYNDYYNGVKPMGSCGCGAAGEIIMQAKQAILDSENDSDIPKAEVSGEITSGITNENVRMEFIGPQAGAVTFFGQNGRQYRGGNNPRDKYDNMHPDDVAYMELTGQWRRVQRTLTPDPAPQSEPEIMEIIVPPVMVGEPDKVESFLVAEGIGLDEVKPKRGKKKRAVV
jgi:glycosyltransferase involved in cell wall biosynthesis